MEKLDLSPKARRCLWECYSLLLRLAEEADEDTPEETEPDAADEPVRTTKSNRLAHPNKSSKAEPMSVVKAE